MAQEVHGAVSIAKVDSGRTRAARPAWLLSRHCQPHFVFGVGDEVAGQVRLQVNATAGPVSSPAPGEQIPSHGRHYRSGLRSRMLGEHATTSVTASTGRTCGQLGLVCCGGRLGVLDSLVGDRMSLRGTA
jgi:hypothetical protein